MSRLLLYSVGLTALQVSPGLKPAYPPSGLRPTQAVVSMRLEKAGVRSQLREEEEEEEEEEEDPGVPATRVVSGCGAYPGRLWAAACSD